MASIMNEHAAYPYLRQAEMKECLKLIKLMGTVPRLSHITRKRENRAIIVSNIGLDTKKKTITKCFKKFGYIFSIELVKDGDGEFTGVAHVEYNTMPRKLDINQPIIIDDQLVKMEYGRVISVEHRPTTCFAKTFSLGSMLKTTEFVDEWTTNVDVVLSVDYHRKVLDVTFRHLGTRYQMETKFGNINNDVVVEKIEHTTFLTISLNEPAKYYEMYGLDNRRRINRIPLDSHGYDLEAIMKGSDTNSPTLIYTMENFLRLDRWTVCRIKFEPQRHHQHWLSKLLAGMADYNLVPRDEHLGTNQEPRITVVPAYTLPAIKSHEARARILNFDVLYHLECNISANYLLEHNLDDTFYSLLSSLDPSIACGILNLMATQKKRVWYPTAAIRNIYTKYKAQIAHKRRTPHHCAMLRKVIITPTSTYVEPLSLETANRVVRNYSAWSDRFIRVQFSDEGKMRVSPTFQNMARSPLLKRIFATLRNGIQIGDRRYEYLGFSSSQLREHGCWFYAPSNGAKDGASDLSGPDLKAIHTWMGNFSDIKIVAKHAARIGQCFSSTMAIMKLRKDQVKTIDDIEVDRYTFTDGIGNISRDLAFEVSRRMSLRTVPSAFQFRLGGAKGLLMVSNKLKGRILQLRPSQKKFTSEYLTLEVVRTSSTISAYLNRQSITLLSALGVKDTVFTRILGDTIGDLNRMLAHPKQALKVLSNSSDSFGIRTFMADIISAGYMERQDPFIKNLINVFRLRMLKNLKEKAKLPVKKGAFLFGAIDETGVLKEGEIFCQVSSGMNQKYRRVIRGECVVYRNPCFHPGDIRVVTAVDCPSLHHLRDLVVFPSVGEQDIPSMCSGGDLDGDEYTVIWDPILKPAKVNHAPMDYTPAKPDTKSNVSIEDIQQFFVKYINNDNLGQIANAHLALADDSEEGAMDKRCLELAELHSAAVDFPKTGIPAIMDPSSRLSRFPDFMAKEDKPMYKSEKVLGKMYRRIDRADYDKYEEKLVEETVYDTRLRIPGMERYIAGARQSLEKYNLDMVALMNQFGVKTEAELISGFVISWLNGRNRKSEFEAQKQATAAASNMRRQWKQAFMREFKDAIKADRKQWEEKNKDRGGKRGGKRHRKSKQPEADKTIQDQMEAKAAAWYYVAYHPTERGRDLDIDGNYFSFPWVMHDLLVKIGKRKMGHPIKQSTTTTTTEDEDMKPVDEDIIRQYQVDDFPDEDTKQESDGSDYDFDYDLNYDYDGGDDGESQTTGTTRTDDTDHEGNSNDSDNGIDDDIIDLAIGSLQINDNGGDSSSSKQILPPDDVLEPLDTTTLAEPLSKEELVTKDNVSNTL